MNSADVVMCRKLALDTFQAGIFALHRAQEGDSQATEDAIIHLRCSLEFEVKSRYLELWVEIHLALADAYAIRVNGTQLENACLALTYYQASLKY